MNKKTQLGEVKLIVSIDFGTTFSGFAFTSKPEKSTEFSSTKIFTHWGDDQRNNYKTNTFLLYKDGKPIEWGWDALSKHDPGTTFLLKNFKLRIKEKSENGEAMVEIGNGKKKPTSEVVGDFLTLMKGFIDKEIRKSLGYPPKAEYTKWVLTVPAIWDNKDKEIMRKAAEYAKIFDPNHDDNFHFSFALEPESAALACLDYTSKNAIDVRNGTKFIVLDNGGGTIDITSYELHGITKENPKGKLKEIFSAQGGAMGGSFVNIAFEEKLGSMLGDEFKNLMQSKEYYKLWEKFEKMKKGVTSKSVIKNKTIDGLPKQLRSLFASKMGSLYDEDDECLILPMEMVISFFKEPINCIIDHVKKILSSQDDTIDYIFCVGGFSYSDILFEEIEKEFSSIKVIRPFQCGEMVMSGAIEYGKDSSLITSRKSKYSYGYEVVQPFDPDIHSESDKVFENYCKGFYHEIIKKDQDLETGEIIEEELNTIGYCQTSVRLTFFQADECKERIDDPSVVKLVYQDIYDIDYEYGFQVKYFFGSEEVKVTITNNCNGVEKRIFFNIQSKNV